MASNVRDNTELHRFELDAEGHVAFSNYKRAGGVLDIARSQGLKVMTVCPFAKSYIERHPEYADLLA